MKVYKNKMLGTTAYTVVAKVTPSYDVEHESLPKTTIGMEYAGLRVEVRRGKIIAVKRSGRGFFSEVPAPAWYYALKQTQTEAV